MVRHEDVWIVFSWLEDVLASPLHLPQPGVNWDALAGQLLFGELGGRETALQGVTQVLPGEAIEAGPALRSSFLWNAVDIARTALGDESPQAAQDLRHTVRACTQAWAGCYDDMLFRLSGGVDSSILLSCLTRSDTSAGITCVNFHSPGADSDERTYARLAAARAGRELVECERDTTFRLDSILQIARTPTPVNHVGRMNSRIDAKLAAKHSATAMFTGAGGDQLFYEFLTWWPAADYMRGRGLDAGFLAAAMDAARLGRVSVWSAMARALGERLRPCSPWQEIHKHLPLLGTAAWGMTAQHMRFLHPVLSEISDLPIGKATQLLSLVHPVPYYDPFERDAAPESVHPLLSQPLVEMCLQLPTWVLTRGGRGRALARRAFASDLPPQIASRRSKGGMEEHVQAVLLRHIDFARSMLLDGELVRRGLLDRKKVEETLSGRPTVLASHTGRVHVYIAIEAWLQRWSAMPARATA
jgi:asparagine synthase (glutamine-hydrolysing)